MNDAPRPAASPSSPKLRPWHLELHAVVYVRQSTPQQVLENQESTARQYALVGRATQLGWAPSRVQVIDDDLGRSGQSIEGRPGFQRLLAEVALDRVGLILGLEMSRLARSCRDWHQLLELCARYRTLLADADGVYDPTDYKNSILLCLKGTKSGAELHVLKERMHQGKLNKARRGELVVGVPVGYVKHPTGEVTLDPDEQVQGVVRLIFDEFDRQATIHGVLRYLNEQGIRMPVRPTSGPNRGRLEWRAPCRETLRQMLHHPIYAGAYRYGYRPVDPRRQQPGRRSSGRISGSLNGCLVLIKDRFPAYITWDRFEANQQRLAANRARAGSPGAVREGAALLAGVVWCGRCGRRMYVRYSGRRQRPSYVCSWQRSDYGLPLCQSLPADAVEGWVTEQLLAAMQPASLAASIAAVTEVERQRAQLTRHWQQRMERARYEVERAAGSTTPASRRTDWWPGNWSAAGTRPCASASGWRRSSPGSSGPSRASSLRRTSSRSGGSPGRCLRCGSRRRRRPRIGGRSHDCCWSEWSSRSIRPASARPCGWSGPAGPSVSRP